MADMSIPIGKAQRYPPPQAASMMADKVMLPFVGEKSLPDFTDLARIAQGYSERNLCQTDEQYFDEVTKTMDAFKDLMQWTLAQINVIETTYANDSHRRELHLAVLRNGFRSLTHRQER
jgi:hypothetical protein